jgi:pimeloyl-ACP methyl ester carboxylesterase
MPSNSLQPVRIPVTGGTLHAVRFGDGPHTVLAAHGITGQGTSFAGVARRLPADYSLVALDLRGRGASADLPGPYGLARHAEDVQRAAEHLGAGGKVTLTGHSMGAYVALTAAAGRPHLFDRVVLVDGGLPLPVPDDFDPDAVLEATLGPALARLAMTFPDTDAYVGFFRAHPSFGPYWNPDMEAYVRADVAGPSGALRPRAREEAVRADGRDLLTATGALTRDLGRLDVPALLLYAPRNLTDQEPGLQPPEVVAHWESRVPALRAELVPDENHYTILLGAGAPHVAARLTGDW